MSQIISKGRFLPGLGILSVILTLALIYINLNFCQKLFRYEYFQIDTFIFAVALFVCTLYFLTKAFAEYKAVDVYEKHLIIKWVFGLVSVKIEKSEILAFGHTTKYKINYLYLKTEKQVYLFIENMTENNFQLFEQLNNWGFPSKDEPLKNKIEIFEIKFLSIISVVAGLCMLTLVLSIKNHSQLDVNYEDLFLVEGHLNTTPDIDDGKNNRETSTITLELSEYPELRFKIYNFVNPSGYFNTFGRFQKGQQAIFMITLNDYNKKIIRTEEPTFKEKHFFWPEITVYEAIINKNMELKFNNKTYENDPISNTAYIFLLILLSLMGIICIIFGINKMKKVFHL